VFKYKLYNTKIEFLAEIKSKNLHIFFFNSQKREK